MADAAENDTTATAPEPHGTDSDEGKTPTVEELLAQVDTLTRESRKWEARSKENYEARKELDEIRKSQMTESEKQQAAVSAAEQRAAEAEARAEKAALDALRFRIAASHEISDEDATLFLTGSDEETLKAQAERLSARSTGPRPNPAQGHRGGNQAPTSNGERFAQAVESLL